MAKKKEYVSMMATTEISASSKIAMKIKDNYYTIQASETKTVIDDGGIDMDKEWDILFDELNEVVDKQCDDIAKTFNIKKQ